MSPTLAEGGVSLVGISPPVLFFFLGMVAALVRSNLRVPPQVTKLLSLYLLWAIGFRGGIELQAAGLGREELLSLGAAVFMAVIVPLYAYWLFRRWVDAPNAAALAATYGSISAVTFVTACTVLQQSKVPYGGHMVAAMALMESPAIVISVLLLRTFGGRSASGAAAPRLRWGHLLHESFLNGPVLLLLGSLTIGVLTGADGYALFKPLCTDLFSGVLVFFLLDLGLVAARQLRHLRRRGPALILLAVALPIVNATIAAAIGHVLGLQEGNAILLVVLSASASYIAVPAAMRLMVPDASPGIYLPMALAITFPFNIGVGIPLFMWIVRMLN